MRIAIATGCYYKPGETFVNRHIEHLFGGDTVVIANKLTGCNPFARPVIRRSRGGFRAADLWQQPLASALGKWRYGATSVPYGQTRRALEGFLRAERVAAILCEFGPEAVALAPVANAMALPIFTYFRGYDASKDLSKPRNVMALRKTMPRLAGVFSVSQFLLDNLARHGITLPHSQVIPSGVATDLFVPGDKQPGSFLAVGRLIDKKAPDITLRAFLAGAAEHPHARLGIIGEGPMLESLRQRIAACGIGERVTLHGALPHEQVREMLARTEVFVQHSLTDAKGNTEGLPTAVQEALSAGCIVLSTRHAGIPEAVIEGETGYLVAEHDEVGFARLIRGVLDGSLPVQGMAGRARALAVERFDNGRLLALLEQRLEALMPPAP
ncbi:glycosyltransferase [Frigidibacter mobilis]|uniref:Glycosyl transferase, group 1 n=1 Tax=Frigidibacter mobilis TaxID=1335048 RepID=A0A165SKT8_9RHOB|nr:glycosyltransferase [Frigidibacter mobilis]AMY69013.1 glycosyl transferase, group 1 [Frigidibacter mobilis]